MSKPTIVIIGYSRPKLLQNCIESTLRADGNDSYSKILLVQRGFKEVEEIAASFAEEFDSVIFVDRDGTAIQNISKNRYLAYTLAFSHFGADFTVVLEDDVEISVDALDFTRVIFEKYRNERSFRAINLGSGITFVPDHVSEYSIVRYALNGPASAMTKRTWDCLDLNKLMKKSNYEIFDGTIEPFIQTGFVVMPNASRYIDHGVEGVHSTAENNSPYFEKLRSSFVKDHKLDRQLLRLKFRDQNWRFDCVEYRPWLNAYYHLRWYAVFNRENRVIGSFLRLFRNFLKYLRST